ncbi:uncharacterized protein LOC131293367 [Anopheles ziemanni]|uniref:uncharacterized protein LOC131267539 n=1 Tax=Anopheles coustani TaxID=139045 RepID=UPI00265A39BE|nr:uncharacterized protein LOC131267539 [Anopheles coustani]XP_058177429.1 uncharacterized protein LOC131293367 [Anopheles ziemanni]
MYNNFNTNRCNNCFRVNCTKPSTKTKIVCPHCKLIKYCSVEHQVFDWNIHQPFCQAVASVMKATNAEHILGCAEAILDKRVDERDRKRQLQRKIDCAIFLAGKVLNRPLEYHERILLQHPLLCNVCQNVSSGKLKLCGDCHQVAYCSQDHQDQDQLKHSKWCKEYALNFMLNHVEPKMTNLTHIPELDDISFPCDNYKLAGAVTGRELRKPSPDIPAMNQLEDLKYATHFSWVGTILYLLQTTGIPDQLGDKLVIYIVGACKEPIYFNRTTCAALFAYLPKLETVKICFIGPELLTTKSTVSINYHGGQKVEHMYYRSLYHELPGILEHPQLIVAMNCGFNDINNASQHTWPQTIRSLLGIKNVTFAFTSYTYAEAIDDCTIVLGEAERLYEEEKFTFVKRAAINPFRDLQPLRNPDILDEKDELYYDNGYLSIAIRK